MRRCVKGIRAPSRRKACQQCSITKTRCDLKRPSCGRCHARHLDCAFGYDADAITDSDSIQSAPAARGESIDEGMSRKIQRSARARYATTATRTAPSPHENELTGTSMPPQASTTPSVSEISRTAPTRLVISNERRQSLSGAAPGLPSSGPVSEHIMHYIIRVLKSWPRLLISHELTQLPPVIHTIQLENNVPTPLADCLILAKMWAAHTHDSASLVQRTVLQEVRRLLQQVSCQIIANAKVRNVLTL